MGAASDGQVEIRNTRDSNGEASGGTQQAALLVHGGATIKKDLFVGGGKEIATGDNKAVLKMADNAEIQDSSSNPRIAFTDTVALLLNQTIQ